MDRKILALLQREGRRSFADLGREVGLSTPAVKRRVDRLEASGVIRGYAAVVDASKLGFGFEAIAEIYCAERTTPRDVLSSVEGIDEVVSAVTVSGEPDAVLRVQVDDIRHLERVIEALRRRPNIVRTRTMIVLERARGPADRPGALAVARQPHSSHAVNYDDFDFGFSWWPDEAHDAHRARARRRATACGSSTRSTCPRRSTAPPRSARPPACSSCSTATTATAPRSPRASASRTCACRRRSPAARSRS